MVSQSLKNRNQVRQQANEASECGDTDNVCDNVDFGSGESEPPNSSVAENTTITSYKEGAWIMGRVCDSLIRIRDMSFL